MELAIQTYTRALQLEPNSPQVYNNLVSGTQPHMGGGGGLAGPPPPPPLDIES
jgi:hypothetical protein